MGGLAGHEPCPEEAAICYHEDPPREKRGGVPATGSAACPAAQLSLLYGKTGNRIGDCSTPLLCPLGKYLWEALARSLGQGLCLSQSYIGAEDEQVKEQI